MHTEEMLSSAHGERRRARKRRRKRGKGVHTQEIQPTVRQHVRPREDSDDPHRLARRFLKRHGTDEVGRLTLRHWGGGWWKYEEGRYRLLDDAEANTAITAAIKQDFDEAHTLDGHGFVRKVTPQVSRSVEHALRSLPDVFRAGPVEPRAWLAKKGEGREFIALKNGLLDVARFQSDGELLVQSHTPEWFTTACLPYEFDPEGKSPRWQAFLKWMFEGDEERIAFVQEWFGYCLVPDTSQRVFVVAVGDGANGKSVVLETLRGLVGEENTSSVALEDFRSEFHWSATIGKLVNICPEIGDVERLPEGKLKAFVGGDKMSFNRKYKDPLEVKPTARLIFATNKVPRFGDKSEGVWSRLVILPCRVSVLPDQQDPDLARKLRQELPGILNWALEGLKRLRERGHFRVPKVSREALEEHRTESNPERLFFEECCIKDVSGRVRCEELYRAYAEWCRCHGHRVADAAQFGKEVRRVLSVERRRGTNGARRPWVYEGVRLSQVSQGEPTQTDMRPGACKYAKEDMGSSGTSKTARERRRRSAESQALTALEAALAVEVEK